MSLDEEPPMKQTRDVHVGPTLVVDDGDADEDEDEIKYVAGRDVFHWN